MLSSECEELDIDSSSSQKSLVPIIWALTKQFLLRNREISTVAAAASYFLPKFSSKRANLRLNCNLQTQNEISRPASPPKAVETKTETTDQKEDEKSPVWQPFGAPYDGPQFRPVKLGLTQTKMTTTLSHNELPKEKETVSTELTPSESPCTEKDKTASSPSTGKKTISPEPLPTSNAPTIFTKTGWGSHLPPSQSPTITLLQKAREGQIPKGAVYIEEKSESVDYVLRETPAHVGTRKNRFTQHRQFRQVSCNCCAKERC
ncbi:hypothetical protein TNCV_4184781 [Trichonephila clavipes]|nr:hypothetical protein TNCV_4184781 [Trichonephila clavipes]